MKHKIGAIITLCCFLSGCDQDFSFRPIKTSPPPLWEPNPFHQDGAPMPWVRVLPTERAIAYKGEEFPHYARMVRENITTSKVQKKYINTRLVLVDYGVLPATKPSKCMEPTYQTGNIFCENFIPKPERYFVTLSFYGYDQRPKVQPFFMGTAYLPTSHAASHEALRFLLMTIVEEYEKTNLSKIEVDLDSGFRSQSTPK
jgi:hypothetical protein